jgi:glutathionylspermidine synthase
VQDHRGCRGTGLGPDRTRRRRGRRTPRWVWKTWAWETALDEIRTQVDDDDRRGTPAPATSGPRLADVLLRKKIMVFEPFWTAIPDNKAILPVLWESFPDHPSLLESRYELTPALARIVHKKGGRTPFNPI